MYKVTFKNVSAVGIKHGCPNKEFEFEVKAHSGFQAMRAAVALLEEDHNVVNGDCYYDMKVVEIKPVVLAFHRHDPKKLEVHIGSLRNNLQWALSKCNMMDPNSSGGTMNELSEVLMSLKFAGSDCEAIRKEIKGISVTVPVAGSPKT